MSKPKTTPQQKPYDGLIERELSPDEVVQLDFKLVRFVELLIKLDKQKNEKLKES